MEILTDYSEEIKEKRKYFFSNALKVNKILKGDKRVNGTRVCAICGTRLSTVILTNSTTMATKDHYHCYFTELFYVNICSEARHCKKALEKGDETT